MIVDTVKFSGHILIVRTLGLNELKIVLHGPYCQEMVAYYLIFLFSPQNIVYAEITSE